MSILAKLMPKSDAFFDSFEKQAALTVEGARLFKEMFEDFTDIPHKVKAIKDVEHKADDVTHAAFELLYTQFITRFNWEQGAAFGFLLLGLSTVIVWLGLKLSGQKFGEVMQQS